MRKSITTTVTHDEISATINSSSHIIGTIDSNYVVLGGMVVGGQPAHPITAQEKTVTPLYEEQVVVPDEDYDYLSQVTVEAIPYVDGDVAEYGDPTVPIAGVGQSDYMVLGDDDGTSNVVGYAIVGSSMI